MPSPRCDVAAPAARKVEREKPKRSRVRAPKQKAKKRAPKQKEKKKQKRQKREGKANGGGKKKPSAVATAADQKAALRMLQRHRWQREKDRIEREAELAEALESATESEHSEIDFD